MMTPIQTGNLINSIGTNQNINQGYTQTPNVQTANTQAQEQNTITNNNQDQNASQTPQNNKDLEKEIKKALDELTSNLSYLNTHLNISLDKKADSLIIKIIDNKTNQVIKEIPPEYMVKIAEAINNLVGIIVNKRV